MRLLLSALSLGLAACGGTPANNSAADMSSAETTDAVTEEAVRDTQAAEADALKAADAELDRLDNSIDDAPAPAGDRKGVSNSTAVTVY